MKALSVVSCLGIGLVLVACGDDKEKAAQGRTYHYVSHSAPNNPFWTPMRNGMDAAAAAYGATALWTGNLDSQSAAQMPDQIQAAIDEGVDGLAVTISVQAGNDLFPTLREKINDAVDAGIPVVAINNPEYGERTINYSTYVGQYDDDAGYAAAMHALETATARGIVVTNALCIHTHSGPWSESRCGGMRAALVDSGLDDADILEVPSLQQYGTDAEKAAASGTLDDFFAANDPSQFQYIQMTAPASTPLIVAKNFDNKVIGCFDADDAYTLDAVEDGSIDFTIDQQPYLQGYMPIVLFELMHSASANVASDVATGPDVIDGSNVAEIKDLQAQGLR